jgi:diketogulonate reductase-like aldo/keto reductase
MPYGISQPLEERIHTSIASSFANLQTSTNPEDTYIDCLVLHSPLPKIEDTQTAWETLSTYVPHKIRSLGISNTTYAVLQTLHNEMTVKPSVVQNRFYPNTDWEVPLRKYCREQGIIFQSFWTFTGNPTLMKTNPVVNLAGELNRLGVEDPEVVALYSLVLGLEGIAILDGTTKFSRMKTDLEGLEIASKWADGDGKEKWASCLSDFKQLIGENES